MIPYSGLSQSAAWLVLFILLVGIGGFAKGGEFNRKHANQNYASGA